MALFNRPKDAAEQIRQHQKIKEQLEMIGTDVERHRSLAMYAVQNLILFEVMKILEQTPLDEINRGENRFRIKILKENGYCSLLDVFNAKTESLCAFSGFGAESARLIKDAVNDLAEQARVGAKIRISSDQKTDAAERLLISLQKFDDFRRIHKKSSDLLYIYGEQILRDLERLQPAKNIISWLITSKNEKEAARNAYDHLTGLLGGEYGRKAEYIIDEAYQATAFPPSRVWDEFTNNPVKFYNILEELCPDLLGNDDTVYGLTEEVAEEIREETFSLEGFHSQLRKYQSWGVRYILHQKKVLLGDEMGLGKTIQAIAAMTALRNRGKDHFLVICPAGVLENWCREIKKHSNLQVVRIYGKDRLETFASWKLHGGTAVTTYETVGYLDMEQDFVFHMVVVDEAHYIKNPGAQRSRQVKRICGHTDRILLMTGTALENKVDEMLELLWILKPEIAVEAEKLAMISSAPRFRETIIPVYYRRKREDVLTELPDMIKTQEWCALGEEEEALYEKAILENQFTEARRVSWNLEDLSKSSKACRLLELIEEAEEENRKILVFSFFLDTIKKVKKLLGDRCMEPINGSVSPKRRQEILDEFEKAPAGTVLAAQILAGGTGLNIQSASVVILCEPQFKPSIENQAISRAYRMGQTRNVCVYRLLCQNTIDERITALLEQKQAEFDAFADESAAAKEEVEVEKAAIVRMMQSEQLRINEKNSSACYGGTKNV